jgi:peptidoglycan-N-acetylglucosamine deacetylase
MWRGLLFLGGRRGDDSRPQAATRGTSLRLPKGMDMRVLSAAICLLMSVAIPTAQAADFAWGRTRTRQPWVALTFDCCETKKPAGYDQDIVKALLRTHTPATFFLGGRWVETHPEAMKQLAGCKDFELANHSYLHPHLTQLSAAQVKGELQRTQALVAGYGRLSRFVRPPYGEYNGQTLAVARQLGLRVVTWSIVTGDPDKSVSADEILRAVKRSRPGDIIIMHANGRGWHTAQALPRIITWLQQRGLQPVRLSTLLGQSQ